MDFMGCYWSFWVKGWGVQLVVVVIVTVVFVEDHLQVIVFVFEFQDILLLNRRGPVLEQIHVHCS